jgi:cytochrome bd ubiquinol oxidase subunit II
MLEVIIIFLGLSLLFYVLFGGADYGAGIIELFSVKKYAEDERKVINSAMGPVWEANHIWLIIVIVILFMGFPKVYTEISIYLHIPLLSMLLGIIMRGCAFTFRHYDAVKDESQKYYTNIFHISSIWTPLFLGVVLGASVLGKIEPGSPGFYENYIATWLNVFSFSVGIFVCCLFAFLAGVYLIGETESEVLKKIFVKRAIIANILTVLSGAFVFIAAEINGLHLISQFTGSTFALLCMVLATVSLPFMWYFLKKEKVILSRMAAGYQVCMIMFAWFAVQFPVIIKTTGGNDLTFYNTAAPDSTLNALGWALLIGSVFILPALYFLLRTFKRERE